MSSNYFDSKKGAELRKARKKSLRQNKGLPDASINTEITKREARRHPSFLLWMSTHKFIVVSGHFQCHCHCLDAQERSLLPLVGSLVLKFV